MEAGGSTGLARSFFRLARPKQWTKNGFVLAGVVFAEEAFAASSVLNALLAFAAFCLLSGAVYAFNDVLDVEEDRKHPLKRLRPVASNEVPVPAAIAFAGLLLVIGLAFTGYLLRWDQDGFWASVVGMKIGSYSPFVGGYVVNFLLGGDVAGPATLSRFFALHVWLLPAAIAPFIGIHLYLLRRHGVFGSDFEYSERLAKLHERQRLEEYGSYELDEDEEEYDGRNGRDE